MQIKEKIFYFVKKNIIDEDHRNDIFYFKRICRFFLLTLSYFYLACINIRNFLYDKKILKNFKIKNFVISIGNIVVGGTGKTPFTLYLAQKLLDKGFRESFQLDGSRFSGMGRQFCTA